MQMKGLEKCLPHYENSIMLDNVVVVRHLAKYWAYKDKEYNPYT